MDLLTNPDLFKDVLNSIPQRVWIMDSDSSIVWENAAGILHMNRCGCPSATDPTVLTTYWRDELSSTGFIDTVLGAVTRGLQGESGVVDAKRRTSSGQDRWMRVEFHPLHNGQGDITGVYGIETDITLQKEALPRLLALQEKPNVYCDNSCR